MSSTFDGSSPAASNSSPLAGYGTVDQGLLLPANVPLSAETCQVIKKKIKNTLWGIPLVVWWLGLSTCTAMGLGLIPGWGTKIL